MTTVEAIEAIHRLSVPREIPVEFYNEEEAGKPYPTASTVGELREQLARLPSGLAIESFMSTNVTLRVYSYGEEDMHLEFGE